MHPEIFEFDRELRAASEELASVIEDAAEELAVEESDTAKPVDDNLLDALKRWRSKTASDNHVPPYLVAHNTLLETLATRPPATPQQLLGLPGFGQRKLEQYGDDILAITRPYATAPEEGTPNAPAMDVVKPAGAPASTLDMSSSSKRAPGEWTEEDDRRLLQLFYAGTPLNESATILKRDPDAIWSRLTQLRQG
jgi:ribonuclease D